MNRFFSALFLAAGLLASGMPSPADASTPPQQHALAEGKNSPVSPQQRKQAVENLEKLLGKRLFKKAAEQALKQLHEYDDQYSGADLLLYYQALTRLNALDDSINLDSILQEQMKLHGANPHFLRDAALLYQSACHTFKLVDGAYIRGAGPWDGEYSGEARDRVEALRCLVKAMQLGGEGQQHETSGTTALHHGTGVAGQRKPLRSPFRLPVLRSPGEPDQPEGIAGLRLQRGSIPFSKRRHRSRHGQCQNRKAGSYLLPCLFLLGNS